MDLDALKNSLINLSRPEFDNWLIENEKPLSNFFYKLNGHDLHELKFDVFYYNDILTSSVYKEYHNTRYQTDAFDFFLNLIAISAEKLAEIKMFTVSKNLISDLPESPSKYRLEAINKFAVVEDYRTMYITLFPSVLESLDKSRLLFEEGSIRPIIDVLVFYYKKAKTTLENAGCGKIVIKLKELYQNEDLIKQYPFLSHQILDDLIDDKDPFALYTIDVIRDRLEPSIVIKTLFGDFNNAYFNHKHVEHFKNNLWGYTVKQVLDDVLVRGRGDFTSNYGKITADDKVMLYCFFNLKKHFFTSYAVYQTVTNSIQNFFSNSEYKPVFIDLGCGPMTSGLALADLVHSTTDSGINFSYIGVDISTPMMNKAKTFKSLEIFSEDATFNFFTNWNEIDHQLLNDLAGKNNPIIFNASYLFASSSVNPFDLGQYVMNIAKTFKNVFFVFQNPNRIDRNIKYEVFKENIKYELVITKCENIRYMAASNEANEDVSYEILKL
jgi:hypothetical protein